jgi:heme-degrading monooxygenase HmoA
VASLVKNLKPPFYVAIINDNKSFSFFNNKISPIDKMVSIAPHQPGFLGLETTRDKQGKWVTISYWSDINSEKSWEEKGDKQIRKHFNGTSLKETCAIYVTQINYKLSSSKKLYMNSWPITKIIMSSSIGALIVGSFSVILHMLSHKVLY